MSPPPYHSIEALLDTLYEVISGPAGPRRWTKERELFHPLARLMRTGTDADGRPWIKIMSLTEYIADVSPFLAGRDFYEIEIAREIDRFGNVAQVRSVYEAHTTPPDSRESGTPERRGVNFLQLYHDGKRWWVLSILWDNERDGVQVPEDWQRAGV